MKIGPRIPSLRKKIAARTSLKRYVRHNLGFKAPKGWGWFTNPKKALYNRVYNRTTFSIENSRGLGVLLILFIFGLLRGIAEIGFVILKCIFQSINRKSTSGISNSSANSLSSSSPGQISNIVLPGNNIQIPFCPRCSSVMVQRVATKGVNSGSSFWGCSKFPKCRGTRPI